MSLEIAIEHRQGAFRLEAAFSAPPGLTALFGRSGSGKTTLVDAVAGLVRPARGRIAVDGTTLLDTEAGIALPPHKRRLGYVFQEGRLFPHLNVRHNLLFGRFFAARGRDFFSKRGRDLGRDLDATVWLLGIGHLLERRPETLSGGEKQRVAIGRALLARPRLLLMDEPLAALDEARKAEILPHLERLRDRAGIPILYVSHAVAEVARLATTVVVLEEGRVVACGPAVTVLGGALAAEREGGAVLEGRVVAHDPAYGLTELATSAGPLVVPRLDRPVGATIRALVRARDVTLALTRPEGVSALNVWPGTVSAVGAGEGAWVPVRVACGGAEIVARVTRRSVAELDLAPGRPVHALVKSAAFDAFAAGEGEPWRD